MYKRLLITLALVLNLLTSGKVLYASDKYVISQFQMREQDLTGRVYGRKDLNGELCAVIKVHVKDTITKANGSVIGELTDNGMEKLIYLTPGTKFVELLFKEHMPLFVDITTFGYKGLLPGITYVLDLEELGQIRDNLMPNEESNSDQNASTSSASTVIDTKALAIQAYNKGEYSEAMLLFDRINDDSEAQTYIATMYRKGLGTVHDDEKSLSWITKAANQGYAKAQTRLGYYYQYNIGVKRDYKQAMNWYKKAAAQNYAPAQSKIGYMYSEAMGVKKNYKEASKWYLRAANQGYAPAQFRLGEMYFWYHYLQKTDYEEAVKWYRKAADQGLPMAQAKMGFMYAFGYGVAQNLDESARWYTLAAEQGDVTAQKCLAHLSSDAKLPTSSKDTRDKWIRVLAENNNAMAQKIMGDKCYQANEYSKALDWYNKAANKSYNEAILALAEMYMTPSNEVVRRVAQSNLRSAIKADDRKAKELLMPLAIKNYRDSRSLILSVERNLGGNVDALKAQFETIDKQNTEFSNKYKEGVAAIDKKKYNTALSIFNSINGYGPAQTKLGLMYYWGTGVEPDGKTALQWLQKAAENDDIDGLRNIFFMYRDGEVAAQDFETAKKWASFPNSKKHLYLSTFSSIELLEIEQDD